MLLISDGNFTATDFSKELAELYAQKIQVHVMGIGTASGSPYKNNTGALQKNRGKTVNSKLNSKVLQTIAKQGHGIYTEAIYNDNGVKAILRSAQQSDLDEKVVAGKVRQWQDKYYWFIFPVAALLLYLIRQRVLYVAIIICSMGLLNAPDAQALEPIGLFQNSEQKAQQEYVKADFKRAADLFTNPYNKGVALYRDGEYSAAEKYFKQAQEGRNGLAALYNAGNSQMQQQKWRAAIKSYETVLQQDPEHMAAQHNLAIAKQMLAQNKDEDDQQDEDQSDEQDQQQNEQQQGANKDQKQSDQNKQQEQSQNNASQQEQQKQQDMQEKQQQQSQLEESQKNDKDTNENSKAAAAQNAEIAKMDEERAQQWLNRVDSDIKIFLKNKFYIEDVISAQ